MSNERNYLKPKRTERPKRMKPTGDYPSGEKGFTRQSGTIPRNLLYRDRQ